MIEKEIMGIRIKKMRQEKKMTQSELGKILDVSQTTINAWENNRQEPSRIKIYLLCQLFDITPNYLYGLDTKTIEFLNYIKKEDYIKKSNILNEEDKNLIIDKIYEKNSYKNKFNQTKDENYLHYMIFLEQEIDEIIFTYKKFWNFLYNINNTADEEIETNFNQFMSKEEKTINEEIKNLNKEQQYMILAYIEGLKQGSNQRENIIKKIKGE